MPALAGRTPPQKLNTTCFSTKSLSVVGPMLLQKHVHELPVSLTSLYIRIPKTPRTEHGKNDLHYCQRTTASGDCRLRPGGAERSGFGNAISGWAVRLYVSKGARPIAFTTSSLGSWQ